jgi:hypothetical protein
MTFVRFLAVAVIIHCTSCNNTAKQKPVDNTDSSSIKKTRQAQPPEENRILPDDGQIGVKKKAVFLFKNRGFELFSGSPAMGKKYATTINQFLGLDIPGLKIYNLIIPNGFEFEITERYKDYAKPAKDAIDVIFAASDPSIIKINPVDELRKHRKEYIYFNTDHHWTSLGAYYAYRTFCASAGLSPVSLDTIPSKVKPNFLGFFYRLTRAAVLKNNPDSVRYYLFPVTVDFFIGSNSIGYWAKSNMYAEQASGDNSYSVFLQGDLPICKMETRNKNGRKIVLVKESYGNAFAPFLVNNYEKIIVVDQRTYKGNFEGMLKAEGINELLFINNIFAAHTQFHIDDIRSLKDRSIKKLK